MVSPPFFPFSSREKEEIDGFPLFFLSRGQASSSARRRRPFLFPLLLLRYNINEEDVFPPFLAWFFPFFSPPPLKKVKIRGNPSFFSFYIEYWGVPPLPSPPYPFSLWLFNRDCILTPLSSFLYKDKIGFPPSLFSSSFAFFFLWQVSPECTLFSFFPLSIFFNWKTLFSVSFLFFFLEESPSFPLQVGGLPFPFDRFPPPPPSHERTGKEAFFTSFLSPPPSYELEAVRRKGVSLFPFIFFLPLSDAPGVQGFTPFLSFLLGEEKSCLPLFLF